MWEDIVITLANLLFTYALVPQVYHGFKTKKSGIVLQTSALTTIGLYATCLSFFSLALFFSGTVTLVNGTLWAILFIQRLKYRR